MELKEKRRWIRTTVDKVVEKDVSFGNVDLLPIKDKILVYRRYKHVYILVAADMQDNSLETLHFIHEFALTLDKVFKPLREMDFIYDFNKVENVFDEMCVGGIISVTDYDEVVECVKEQSKMEGRAFFFK